MRLLDLPFFRKAKITAIAPQVNSARLNALGLRLGGSIEVLSQTSSAGLLVRIDDTRIALSKEIASLIKCDEGS